MKDDRERERERERGNNKGSKVMFMLNKHVE